MRPPIRKTQKILANRQIVATVLPRRLPDFGRTNTRVFFNYLAVMICKICLDKNSLGSLEVWHAMAWSYSFSFEPNEFERRFYSIVCDLYPGYSYTGGSLAEIWLQREILLPLQVLKSAQVAQALTKTQNIIQKKGSVPQ